MPANRLFENLRLKTVPGLNALLNQEIRAAGVNLNVGGPLDRPAVQMGPILLELISDKLVKSRLYRFNVIPTKAGIQYIQGALDAGSGPA